MTIKWHFLHTAALRLHTSLAVCPSQLNYIVPLDVTNLMVGFISSLTYTSTNIRVSSLWKNHGNLENEKNFFQAWKNHGIWKKPQKPGKIMEFEKINLEKSWNFASDLRHCETNFSRAMRTFQVFIIHAFVHLLRAFATIRLLILPTVRIHSDYYSNCLVYLM